jgi:hypothetical protein
VEARNFAVESSKELAHVNNILGRQESYPGEEQVSEESVSSRNFRIPLFLGREQHPPPSPSKRVMVHILVGHTISTICLSSSKAGGASIGVSD